MSATNEGKLYSPALLSLATELASYPYSADFTHLSSERSRTCGSTIDLGLNLDPAGKISRIGMRVSACAVGQASAALLARSIEGIERSEIDTIFRQLAVWLDGNGPLPDWPGIEAIEPTLDYAGRHEALLLPWKAACSALCKPVAAS